MPANIDWKFLPNMDVLDADDWEERQIQNSWNHVAQAMLALRSLDENEDGVADVPARIAALLAVTGEVVGAGDGVETDFNTVVVRLPVTSGAAHLKYTIGATDYDITEAAGAFTHAGTITSATIDLANGELDIVFVTAPDVDTDVTLDYAVDYQGSWTSALADLASVYRLIGQIVGLK